MRDLETLQEFLNGAGVDAEAFSLRPDYRAVLLAVDGIVPGPSDRVSDTPLQAAEAPTRGARGARPVEDLPHVAAWREAPDVRTARRWIAAAPSFHEGN
ncbi:hypothetical protein [Arthrobacter sp. OAP107]|uniref:hypothetical protein n=1 Tax=Arthrobacter sp. OAP107 TaxID=3156445 RepID=UPI0033958895